MNYDKQWSSGNPGLLIFLIDQSGSMLSPFEGGQSKTEFASMVINRAIDNIINANFHGDTPKDRVFISVIGYNHEVKECCSGFLKDLDKNPLEVKIVKKKRPDGAGGLIEIDYKIPIWVKPITEDGSTNMKGAFEFAEKLIQKWISDNADAPAPIIINVSDGCPYYDGKDPKICMQETTDVANRIMAMNTDDGNPLIFNARIEKDGGKILFPDSFDKMQTDEAKFIFNISSIVPNTELYRAAAQKNGLILTDGARGCVFEADAIDLIHLIAFGSSKANRDR